MKVSRRDARERARQDALSQSSVQLVIIIAMFRPVQISRQRDRMTGAIE
jgi:hypothetical protein